MTSEPRTMNDTHVESLRLSHDRGADAVREAAQEWADLCHDYDLNERGQAVMARLRAALSVPAPTLPALDAERLARALYDADPVVRSMDDARSYVAYMLREALRDAV
jgi:hypothetical protein